MIPGHHAAVAEGKQMIGAGVTTEAAEQENSIAATGGR